MMADTTYLVGLWRRQPAALRFAREHAEEPMTLSWVVRAEFEAGSRYAGHRSEDVATFLEAFQSYGQALDCVDAYARVAVYFKAGKKLQEVGQNDVWIAAAALTLGQPLITHNVRHFESIPGLQVIAVT
jgi:tRNA(fMet)-specific endonuclease VapC